jgi:hypothetical protein
MAKKTGSSDERGRRDAAPRYFWHASTMISTVGVAPANAEDIDMKPRVTPGQSRTYM